MNWTFRLWLKIGMYFNSNNWNDLKYSIQQYFLGSNTPLTLEKHIKKGKKKKKKQIKNKQKQNNIYI